MSSHEMKRGDMRYYPRPGYPLHAGMPGRGLAYFAAMISETVLEKAFMPSPKSRNCSYFRRSAGGIAMFG